MDPSMRGMNASLSSSGRFGLVVLRLGYIRRSGHVNQRADGPLRASQKFLFGRLAGLLDEAEGHSAQNGGRQREADGAPESGQIGCASLKAANERGDVHGDTHQPHAAPRPMQAEVAKSWLATEGRAHRRTSCARARAIARCWAKM